MHGVEATKLLPGLYQGSLPPSATKLRAAGVGLLILCAREHQPSRQALRGVRYLRCPLVDTEQLSDRNWRRACLAADHAYEYVRRGSRVLVTCVEGRNRSGLVCAITLWKLLRAPGCEIVKYIRSRRKGALTNTSFARAVIRRLP